MTDEKNHKIEASFLTLAMSLASSAVMSLGLAPEPQSNKVKVNLNIARFNIDLLEILQAKTKGNLLKEEEDFMTQVLADLKMKYVEVSSRENKK